MKNLWMMIALGLLISGSAFAQDKTPAGGDDPFLADPSAVDPFGADLPIFEAPAATPILMPTLEDRMRTWIIPAVSFQDAALVDVTGFIVKTSQELDPDGKGVNLILKPSARKTEERVTLSLKNVSVRDLIEFSCTVAGVEFRVGANAVMIEKTPPMETRMYSVDPSLFWLDSFSGGDGGFDDGGFGDDPFGDFDVMPRRPGRNLQRVFEAYGVPWPMGSTIFYEPVISQLVVRNTVENLEKFEEVLDILNIQPRQIEINGAFVEFTLADLATIPGLVLPELASTEQLVQLRTDGKGKASPFRVVTINGVNAIIEEVEEIIYPTEFDMSDGASTRIAMIPGAFETREVGQIINVTPTVSPDNHTINLTMLPEQSELVGEIDYGYDYTDENGNKMHVPMNQPIFHSRNVTTSVIVYNGSTLVISGGYDEKNKVMCYVFITACLIKPNATQIRPKENE